MLLQRAAPKGAQRQDEGQRSKHINDPIAGSPTITLLRLFLPPIQSIRSNSLLQILATHNQYQSEETTGGVYKRQGRIQHAILEHAYKGFLVQVRKLQKTIPFTG